MAKRRKEVRTYKYDCTLTGETYVLTQKLDKTDELISVDAYYQLNPEKDDRTLAVKKKLGVGEEKEEVETSKDSDTVQ